MVMLQKVWWKEYSQVHAEYFYFSPVAFPFLRIAGRLEYCYLYILWSGLWREHGIRSELT